MPTYFAENQWGERYIETVNRSEFLTESSADRFDREKRFKTDKKFHRYIFIGSDSGLLIQYLLGKGLPRGSRAIFIEPDKIYTCIRQAYGALIKKTNSGGSDLQISLHSSSAWAEELNQEIDYTWLWNSNISIISSLACDKDYSHCYFQLERQVHLTMHKYRLDFIADKGVRAVSDNQIANAPFRTRQFNKESSFSHTQLAIIISDELVNANHIDWIHENREKLFLVALYETLPSLYVADLKPDCVTCQSLYAEPAENGLAVYSDPNVPLIYATRAADAIVRQWCGPRIAIGPLLPWLTDDSSFHLDHTSGLNSDELAFAISVCLAMTFKQVALLGTGLSTQVAGIHTEPADGLNLPPTLCDESLSSYDNLTIGVSLEQTHSQQILHKLVERINTPQTVVFQVDSMAIDCPAIPLKPVTSITIPASRPKLDLSATVCGPDEPEQILVEQSMKTASDRFRAIRKTCSKALRALHTALGARSKAKYKQSIRQVQKLLNHMAKNHDSYLQAIEHTNGHSQARIIRPALDSKIYEVQDIRLFIHYFTTLDQCAARFIALISHAMDNCKGEHFTDSQGKMSAGNGSVKLACIQDESPKIQDVHYWLKVLVYLFDEKAKGALSDLCQQFNQQTTAGILLHHFTTGLLAECSADNEKAVESYQYMIDIADSQGESDTGADTEMTRLLEESLLRLTQINLDRELPNAALVTLERLHKLLPQYTTSYATLLSASGQKNAARIALQKYLAERPSDITAIKLADELAQASIPPGAYQLTIRRALHAIAG